MPNDNELSLLRAAREAGIDSREEMANFMAQMGHESSGFDRMEESFRYTRDDSRPRGCHSRIAGSCGVGRNPL